jgi:hypothetical protein
MKKIFYFFAIIMVIIGNSGYSQYIPNGGFESWNNVVLFENPDNWTTSNVAQLYEGGEIDVLTAVKTEDCYSGNHALQLVSVMTDPPDEDIIFGHAVCSGSITGSDESDSLVYIGGFPISGNPDSLYGYFKYSLAEDDTAFMICAFKSNGDLVLEEFFPLTGSQVSYTKTGFDLHADTLPLTADTMFVAFACSNFINPSESSTLMIDMLWLTGIEDTIPNYDFEDWTLLSYEEPDEWSTTNVFYVASGEDNPCATKSEDSHSGEYALRLENSYIENMGIILSLASTSDNIFDMATTIPVDFNPSSLEGYYKYTSPESDSAVIVVFLHGSYDMGGEFNSEDGTRLPAAGEYTFFEIPLYIPEDVTMSFTGVVIVPGKNIAVADTNIPGSVLLIDDLDLINPCEYMKGVDIIDFEDTTICAGDELTLDAGTGYAEYTWSTQETTQTIMVNAAGTYKVTVSDGSCEAIDSVTVYVDPCTLIEDRINESAAVVYPNPCDGLLNVYLPVGDDAIVSVRVMDILGHEVHDGNYTRSKSGYIYLNLSDLQPGIYYLRIKTGKSDYISRFFIN